MSEAAEAASALWVSHPREWQPLLDRWSQERPGRLSLHAWPQYGGQQVRGLTLGDDGRERPVRLLAAVPHAHEPAPTAALVDAAAQLLTGRRLDGSPAVLDGERILDRCLITILPDTNSQGRARSPRRVWNGELDNDEFLKVAFGEAADGERFGRYPEWRFSEHRPRRAGIIYEQLDEELWVESNTSRRSTHTRAMDELWARYRYTRHLDLHQHEGDEAALLPATFDDLEPEPQAATEVWVQAVLESWEAAGIRHKGSYVPYRGQPRQQFFREYWAGRCPGMLRITTETRNNRHVQTGEPTPLERQFRSAAVAFAATIRHLTG